MKPLLILCSLAIPMLLSERTNADDSHQYYEVRSYVLGDEGDAKAVNQYLKNALLPALKRQGIGPVGVFANSPNDESGSSRLIVVVPYDSADQIASTNAKVSSDPQYQADAKAYLDRASNDPAYQRIESELLVSMDCMRQLQVDPESLGNSDRVYELRVYESPTERLGDLKVDMFNSGEVPIFLDCGIQPIFIGQAVVGPFTPSLTYLTVYPNEAARIEAWKAFRVHPDWMVLKDVAKYQGTVSKIHKFVLTPKPYSQM
jgi:hypothetical protein